jgi:membrane-associated phospholipid phosphatase
VPAGALMLYGITINGKNGLYSSYSIHKDIQTMFPNFYSPVDRYTQYVPLVAAYATGFIPGTKPRHSNGRRLWMFLQAQVITSVATLALKHYTHQLRPNGSDHLSFPSGHTVQAFMGAALFDVEYPGQMKAVKIGLYTLAGLTGAMAMLNDRHWASDVLFGAGMGIMSVRLLYWSEQHWKKKKLQPR